jgi:hypothetical protein
MADPARFKLVQITADRHLRRGEYLRQFSDSDAGLLSEEVLDPGSAFFR